jgi:uncharacterized membrane protein
MKENVGPADRAIRSVAGPALVLLAVTRLGATRGRLAGLGALIAGVLIAESALTKTCPLNAALGVETP